MTRYVSVLAALSVALMLPGCSSTQPVAAAAAPSASVTNPPAAEPQKQEEVFSGPLIVEHQVDVTAQRQGIVAKLVADNGARVRQGDLLATLDDQQISADLEAARAKTRSIEADLRNWEAEAKVLGADYERAKKMWDAQLITKEELDHAQFKAEADQWDVKRVAQLLINAQQNERSLELEMAKTQIRAPFTGVVARRYIREGQQVVQGDRLFWVTAESPLCLRFTPPERYLSWLKKGQHLDVTVPDMPEEKHTATVTQLSPVVDPASGTFEVLVQLVGPPGQLRPGMTANVHVSK